MKKHNERNAGRKPKFTCKTVLKRIPVLIADQVEELSKQFLTKKP